MLHTLKELQVGNFKEIKASGEQREYIHINPSKQNIKASVRVIKFRDKDTRQLIAFVPSLEISGYGSTEEKAMEMLKFSLHEFYHMLLASPSKIALELKNMGWEKSLYKNKEYSKAYVDINGSLKEFNAVADEVEVELIEV